LPDDVGSCLAVRCRDARVDEHAIVVRVRNHQTPCARHIDACRTGKRGARRAAAGAGGRALSDNHAGGWVGGGGDRVVDQDTIVILVHNEELGSLHTHLCWGIKGLRAKSCRRASGAVGEVGLTDDERSRLPVADVTATPEIEVLAIGNSTPAVWNIPMVDAVTTFDFGYVTGSTRALSFKITNNGYADLTGISVVGDANFVVSGLSGVTARTEPRLLQLHLRRVR